MEEGKIVIMMMPSPQNKYTRLTQKVRLANAILLGVYLYKKIKQLTARKESKGD